MDWQFTHDAIYGAFTREPWTHQSRSVAQICDKFNGGLRSLVLGAPTACHAKGHPILMLDGTIKPVECIVVGDQIMGHDSTPRTVLELCRGQDEMYEISPLRGEPFVVNAGHVLSLRVGRCRQTNNKKWLEYSTVNMTVTEYLSKARNYKHLAKLQHCSVDWPAIPEEVVDPYMLGVLMGDGMVSNGGVKVKKPDPEIQEATRELAMRHGLNFRVEGITSIITGDKTKGGNPIKTWLRVNQLNVRCEDKFIPQRFLTASRHQRLELLAGLMDTDGHCNRRKNYDFISKSQALSSAVVFLARSLGMRANMSSCYKYSQLGSGGLYWRVSISGDCSAIPCRIPRKKAMPNTLHDGSVTGFTIKSIGMGDYYGFSLDGDHMYLDGRFMRHHNSGKGQISTALVNLVTERGGNVIIYNPRRLLTQQSLDRLKADGIDAGARAASLRHKVDHNANVQIAQMQTDIHRVIKQERWNIYDADLVIVDEAHMMMSPKPLELLQRYLANGACVLGMTGTPIGMSGAYRDIVVAASNSELRACGAHVPAKCFSIHEMDVSKVKKEKTGEYNEGSIVRECWSHAIVGYIYDDWRRLNPDAMPTLCAAPGIGESTWVSDMFLKKRHRVAHIDCEKVIVNGETYPNDAAGEVRNQVIESMRKGEFDVLCHCQTLGEGIDIPNLRHLILARPYGSLANYVQSVGRVIRACPEESKTHCVIQDHGGNCLDSIAEVLTPDGWKGIDDEFDRVAGYNQDTGEVTWEPVTDRIKRPLGDGERMVAASNRCIDIRVTEGHELLYKMRSIQDGVLGFWGPYKKATAGALASSKSKFKIPICGQKASCGTGLTKDELVFLGIFMTDGNLHRRTLSISQAAHQPHLSEIVKCLDGCGFDYTVTQTVGGKKSLKPGGVYNSYRIPKGTCKSRPRNGYMQYMKFIDKSVPESLLSVTREEFLSVLYGAHLGDGAKEKGGHAYRITKGLRAFADRMQMLCVINRIKCNIYTDNVTEARRLCRVSMKNPQYSLNIQTDRDNCFIFGGESKSPAEKNAVLRFEERRGNETVWCVSNPTGCIITRRNGKVAIMGNCFRHGSPNADRDWGKMFSMNEKEIAEERQRNVQEGKEPNPIVCPRCGTVRSDGAKCPTCGFQADPRTRVIVQKDGKLKEVKMDQFAPPKPPKPQEITRLNNIFFSVRNARKQSPSDSQVLAIYAKKYGEYPPENIIHQWTMDRFAAIERKQAAHV